MAQAVTAKRFGAENLSSLTMYRVSNFHPYFGGGEAMVKSGMLLWIEGIFLTNKNVPFVQRQFPKLTVIQH